MITLKIASNLCNNFAIFQNETFNLYSTKTQLISKFKKMNIQREYFKQFCLNPNQI